MSIEELVSAFHTFAIYVKHKTSMVLNIHLMSSRFCSSFKSKRYRDKLRSEIKSLDSLLPVDRTTLHRKLDSQTVFRLVISYFRTKVFFKGNHFH